MLRPGEDRAKAAPAFCIVGAIEPELVHALLIERERAARAVHLHRKPALESGGDPADVECTAHAGSQLDKGPGHVVVLDGTLRAADRFRALPVNGFHRAADARDRTKQEM